MAIVSVVLLIAAAAILGGVIVVALGRGGELASFAADASPFDRPNAVALQLNRAHSSPVGTAADIAMIRPPWALFGYNTQVTDDVLGVLARTLTARDIEISSLRQQLADLGIPADARPLPGGGGAAATPPGEPATWSAWQSAGPEPPPPARATGAEPPWQDQDQDGTGLAG
jgi:hypothetical protein